MTGHSAIVDGTGRVRDGSSTAIVPWWSFTKTLIAACTLRLVEEGRLTLDAPVAGQTYTLRALLQHRAGVGNYGSLAEYHAAVARRDQPWTDAELFAHLPAEPLVFTPDTGWAYSNVGYLLVPRLIEAACGEGLAGVLQSRILAPLGLRASRLAQVPADMLETVFEGGHGYHPGWAFHGFVIGPVAEAALALHRLLSGDLLTPASRAAMLDCHPLGGPLPDRPWHTTGYGLGLMMGTMQRPKLAQPVEVVGHSAGGPGSVGAVYRRVGHADQAATAACFLAGNDEGLAELDVLARLVAVAVPENANGPVRGRSIKSMEQDHRE